MGGIDIVMLISIWFFFFVGVVASYRWVVTKVKSR